MLYNLQPRRVAIVGYNRIPFARHDTAYPDAGNHEMMVAAISGLVKRYGLEGKLLGEVAGGAVIKSSREINLMRECVLDTKLDAATPACDVQQACDTGIESAVYIANKIALGQIDAGIAGGVDSTSDVPLVLDENLRKILLAARRSRSFGQRIGQFLKIRPRDLAPVAPENVEPHTGLSMGDHTQITADHYEISREDQDRFAFESHQKLARAYDEGFLTDMITPFRGLEQDNILRRDTTLEKLAKLRPAYTKNGSLTAGNSTPLTDGASCILLATEEWAKANGLPVLAYFVCAEIAAIEYVINRHNLLLSPIYASTRMLRKMSLTLQDFDFYEIHEAFAAQVLATLKVWESESLTQTFGFDRALGPIDRSKLNVKGSSLAAGHPFAATGGRILATMAKLLHQRGSGRGFVSVCAAGGQGITAILER